MPEGIYRWAVVALLSAILVVNFTFNPHRGKPLRVTGEVDVDNNLTPLKVKIENEPVEVTVKNEDYAQTGSAEIAANAAKSQLGLFNTATKLAASPHLSPDDVSKFYNSQTGEYNLDPTTLNQMQVKSDTAENAVKFAKENKTTIDDAWNFLRANVNKVANKAPLDPANAPFGSTDPTKRTPDQQMANNAWWNAYKTVAGQQNAPAGAPAAASARVTPDFEDEAKRLFGPHSRRVQEKSNGPASPAQTP
jgi:hypothetical protein